MSSFNSIYSNEQMCKLVVVVGFAFFSLFFFYTHIVGIATYQKHTHTHISKISWQKSQNYCKSRIFSLTPRSARKNKWNSRLDYLFFFFFKNLTLFLIGNTTYVQHEFKNLKRATQYKKEKEGVEEEDQAPLFFESFFRTRRW